MIWFFRFWCNACWVVRYFIFDFFQALKKVSKPIVSAALVSVVLYVDFFKYGGEHMGWLAGFLLFIIFFDMYRRMDWVAFKRAKLYKKVGVQPWKGKKHYEQQKAKVKKEDCGLSVEEMEEDF